ncbi:MAG: putative ABC transporter permease [Clostridium sp.]|uniref:putative ABC transporter permease n=1 Tax=Clostridium sp. TaxID=1506 RepID=UPI002903DDB5|nr:putative ABC transporter permease [Clostridium sp.]MDU1309823.1 putative ABC transporter permease [Clostridium sp.]MDU1408084.1 putative ABC transporter permease [Clostridium sp.]MDU2994534.1 putative ABC transporter permease [Clostridium sp.]
MNMLEKVLSFFYLTDLYKLVLIFMIGSFIGYIVEMLYCYLKNGRFESRKGVIYGPFSPVYGFGAIVFTILLYRLEHFNAFIIFVVSAVVGAIFEYICSFVQEKTIGTISWQYNKTPLNLGGRTSGLYALYWGVLGLIFLRHTLPYIEIKIDEIPTELAILIAFTFGIFITIDLIISALAVRRQSSRAHGKKTRNHIDIFLDKHYPDEHLKKIYPNMIVIKKK